CGRLARRCGGAKLRAPPAPLEAGGDDEPAGVVAAHYVEAFRATPEGPDAEALAARARDWLSQASERARSLGSPEKAFTSAERALALTPSGRERADLLRQAGQSAADVANGQRAVEYFDEAIATYRE